MGQWSSVGQALDLRNCRVRAEIEEDALGLDPPRAPHCQAHLDCPRADKAALAEEEFEPVGREPLSMDLDQIIYHLAFAPAYPRHVCHRGPGPLPVLRRLAEKVRDLRAVDHVLARQTRNVWSRSADERALDDDSSAALPREGPGDILARLAAPEDDVLDFFAVSHDFLTPAHLGRKGAPDADSFHACAREARSRTPRCLCRP